MENPVHLATTVKITVTDARKYLSFEEGLPGIFCVRLPRKEVYKAVCSIQMFKVRMRGSSHTGKSWIACVASVSVGFGSKERPRNGIFGVFSARKMGREPKQRKRGVGVRKEGNACRQTPGF